MLNENSILQDRMLHITKRTTIAELLGISGRFKHLKIDKDDDKKKYVGELLFSFNLSEQNADLDMMISDLANFKKQIHINRMKNKRQSNNEPSSLNSLFHFLEKNLLEISYITNKEKRKERIKKLFDWFKTRQKYEEDIRSITTKTYKDKGEIEEQEALLTKIKNNKEEISDDGNHRNLELINKKMLYEYERKRLRGPSWAVSRLSSSHSLPRYSFLGKDSKLDTLSMFSLSDFQANDFTTLYSSVNGTNSFTKKNYDIDIPSFIDKPEGGLLEKDYLAPIFSDNNSFLPSIDKETKYSYSFFRPIYNFNDAYIENKIIESKQKNLALKRAQEEIKEKVKEFGLNRARYKENMNNKYELKNVINMYVNKNKFSSSLLQKYKIKEEKEKLDTKKNNLDNLDNNNNAKMSNLDIVNNSASNVSSQSKSNPEQKSSEEIKLELPIIKNIIKKDLKNNVIKSKGINSMKKISFSYSQKMITYNFKDDKEEEKEKENNDSIKKNKFNPKRSFSFRKKAKFFKKRSHSQISSMLGLRMFNGLNNNKIITNKIQNLDVKTNSIIDIDDTKTKKYKISLPKDKVNKQIINKNTSEIFKNTDAVAHIISNIPLIKESMKYNLICKINTKNEPNEKNIDDSISSNNDLVSHNFSLSAFSNYNISNVNQSKIKSLDKKKFHFEKLNRRYNLYKHNFLRMRRSMSNDKKKEYEYLADKIRSRQLNELLYNNEEYEDEIEEEKEGNNSSLLNPLGKSAGIKKNNSLLEAIVNPNDNPVYSRFFLPRCGNMLLSRDEQNKKNK